MFKANRKLWLKNRKRRCLPALDEDGAPELSAFAKLYLMLAEEAYQQIISGTKLWFRFLFLIKVA